MTNRTTKTPSAQPPRISNGPADPATQINANADLGRGSINPGILMAASTGTMIGSVVLGNLLAGQGGYVSPFTPSGDVSAMLTANATSLALSSQLQLASALLLGVFTALLAAGLRRRTGDGPGAAVLLFGGSYASIVFALSAMLSWLTSRPEIAADGPSAQTLSYLAFMTGGPGHVVGLGILIGGTVIAARWTASMPGWLLIVGTVLGVVAILSYLSLNWAPMTVLIPIGRFGGLLWLVVAGFMLGRDRR
ncbi:hypothetical protein LWF01_07570 [Saxibacter everestensis]|uniref:DUF4386 domain-containing protein n=1 Tax=Saxibacter everestensis TaxID=2909229 RepID=A0ABY8QYS8_9MICO|nr:hypothetical protein LWF01_07570 [Brevibacteriaceae bacterium ZFBP1038]